MPLPVFRAQAFQDLTKLMEKAKEMVTLSANIASKIKDKKGDITDDEVRARVEAEPLLASQA